MASVPRLQRYYQGATTSCPRLSFGLLFSPAGSAGACRGSCPPWGAPIAVQARRRAGVFVVHAGRPLSSVLAHGQGQDLPGSLAIHPVTLRRSTTPDDPSRLAVSGASGTAPGRLTPKASSFRPISRLRDASSPAVYASRRALPHAMQDSLPAGGLRLCRAGVEPAGSLREVSGHLILLSRASPGAISVRSCRDGAPPEAFVPTARGTVPAKTRNVSPAPCMTKRPEVAMSHGFSRPMAGQPDHPSITAWPNDYPCR